MTSTLQMTFGIQPTGWTNDDFPEIGNDTPYQVILEQTAQAGFKGGSTGHNYPKPMDLLLRTMQSRGLQIAATWAGTTFSTGVDIDAAFASFVTQVSFLKAVGAQDVVVAELADAVNLDRTKCVITERPTFNDRRWYLLTALLNRAGKYAADQGMQLSYHPHVGTGVMTLEETERLLGSTHSEHVGLCLDTAHLAYGGATQGELEDFTEKHKTRIQHVHLKNVRHGVLPFALSNQYSFYQAIQHGIFTVPGDPAGSLDLRPIVHILEEAGYSRWIIIEAEQNPANADPLECAQIARCFLRQELGY
jgi:inosose dehydratase